MDHGFLVRIDLKDDGYTSVDSPERTPQEQQDHAEKILKYVMEPDKGAYVLVEPDTDRQVGMIMYNIANRDETKPWKTIFSELDRNLFQEDGRFLEIFQLWVHPDYRRQGLATMLKLQVEKAAQEHKVNVIYTHTEETNPHVVELNHKLGYREVRRGPIWDDIVRVSLIKQLS